MPIFRTADGYPFSTSTRVQSSLHSRHAAVLIECVGYECGSGLRESEARAKAGLARIASTCAIQVQDLGDVCRKSVTVRSFDRK